MLTESVPSFEPVFSLTYWFKVSQLTAKLRQTIFAAAIQKYLGNNNTDGVFPLFGKTVSTSKHKGGQEPMRNSLSCLNRSKSRLLRSHPAPATYFHPLPSANASVYRSRWWCASSRQKKPKQHITLGGQFSTWSILWTGLRSCAVPASAQRRETGTQQLGIKSSLSFYETET